MLEAHEKAASTGPLTGGRQLSPEYVVFVVIFIRASLFV